MVKVNKSFLFCFVFFVSITTNEALNVGAKRQIEIHSGLF